MLGKIFLWRANPMFRWFLVVLTVFSLSGCASLESNGLRSASADLLSRTAEALQSIGRFSPEDYQAELDELFDQPYIDPLTRYLENHTDDPDRSTVLLKIRAEQEKRCEEVSDRFARKKPTSENADRFRAGYLYSCPEQVSAYTEQVELLQRANSELVEDHSPAPTPSPATAPPADARQPQSPDEQRPQIQVQGTQQQSDCYLLTTIRNFSAARNACEGPARDGDVRAQSNMAVIARAFEDYESAHHWARMAAETSADASFLLGQMHESGQGVETSAEHAVSWYTKAADLGHTDAPAALERLLEFMSGESSL